MRSELLAWFDQHRRDLPWRRTRDPYGIWVSEVMLQQTQVDRVIGYWAKFIARFPDVRSLAAAEVADVLSMWTGLGYYSRARNLHQAARELVARHGGRVPDELEALLALPGFGRYTAGAVASIAFDREAPLVDGNVARVLSRVFEIDGQPQDKAREAALWARAAELVKGPRPGDLNQALMELGATVCVPREPLCLICPVRAKCGALAHGRVAQLPPPKKAPRRKTLELAVAVARRKKDVLLARREEKGLFGGLWELPSIALPGTLEALLGKRATSVRHPTSSPQGALIGPELLVIERTLTHRQLVLHVHPVKVGARLGKPPRGYVEWRWVPVVEIKALGMSSAMSAVLDATLP